MTVQRYRSVPYEGEAIQFTGDNIEEIEQWAGVENISWDDEAEGDDKWAVMDDLHSSWINFYPGNWIIKGMKGEFYPTEDEVFRAKNELLS